MTIKNQELKKSLTDIIKNMKESSDKVDIKELLIDTQEQEEERKLKKTEQEEKELGEINSNQPKKR